MVQLTIIDRIRDVINHFTNGKVVEFALKIQIPDRNFNNYLTGHSKLSLETIVRIKETYPNINLEWLVMGTGEMLLSEKSKEYVATNSSSVVNESSVNYQVNSAMSVHITDEQASQLILENNRLKAQLLMVEKLYDKLTDKLAKK